MRDFNSYNSNPSSSVSGDNLKTLKEFADKYEGASQNELVSAIIEEAEKGRKRGTLSNADIDRFSSMLSPMLNREQKKQLEKIVNQIKKS